MNVQYRYPGVKPFEASDAQLFFGRERDLADLMEWVKRENLTVMFGRSGYGKSSLVKAGLIPAFNANPGLVPDSVSGEEKSVPNFSLYVRLNLYNPSSKSRTPCNILISRFLEQVGKDDANAQLSGFFQKIGIGRTLWSVFKSSKTAAEQHVYLIFDQFEEFFSYPLEAQAQFRRELSELLYTRIPQTVRDAMDDLDRGNKKQLHFTPQIRVLFVIRSDRLHLLNSMREELPAILKARYELKALNDQQAKDAIVKPAQLSGESFWLVNPFTYEPAALEKILNELAKPSAAGYDPEEQRAIEAFQLQMVCQTIEQSLINRTYRPEDQPTLVRLSDLPDFEQIYEQYYSDKLSGLPDEESRRTAHVLLEEVMVLGEDMSEVRRVSMDKDVLKDTMQHDHRLILSQELLNYLEDKFLIRRENFGGRSHYEISHDVLLAPLVKSRDETRKKSARAKAEAEARAKQLAIEKRIRDAEILAAQERERRKNADRRRRRARLLAIASITGFFLAAATGAWALTQKKRAEQALEALEMEQKKSLKQSFYQTIINMELILKTPDGCPHSEQMIQLNTLPAQFLNDTVLQKRVERLRTIIKDKNC